MVPSLATAPWSPAFAVVVVAVLCVLARRKAPALTDDPWVHRVDMSLAVACGVGFAALGAWVWAPRHLLDGDYIDVDLAVYCTALSAARDGDMHAWPGKLAPLTGHLLAWPGQQFGVLATLTGGALVSAGVFGSALYAWVRAAAGRLGGVAAVVLAGANAHVVLIGRNPSFYAETTALCTLGMAGIASAVRWRSPRALLCGGLGVGLVLIADTRFLSMGVAGAALVLVAALPGRWKALPLRLALVGLPVLGSYQLGGALYAGTKVNPDDDVSGTVLQAGAFLGDVPGYPRQTLDFERLRNLDFAWGVDPVTKIPRALTEIAAMARVVPPGRAQEADVVDGQNASVSPWLVPLGAAVLGALYTLRRRPWSLLAGFGTVAPFVANLLFVARTLPQPRVLALGIIAVPVILGLGLGDPTRRWRPVPTAALLVLLLLATIGVVPSFMSPWADWRRPSCRTGRVSALLAAVKTPARAEELLGDLAHDENTPRCMAALLADEAQGNTWVAFSDALRHEDCGGASPTWWAPFRQREGHPRGPEGGSP